jgi:hypothetical protein
MTAAEAKELAEEFHKTDLEPVLSAIREAAKEGKHVLHWYDSLGRGTEDSLKDLGYVINGPVFHRNETLVTISWY